MKDEQIDVLAKEMTSTSEELSMNLEIIQAMTARNVTLRKRLRELAAQFSEKPKEKPIFDGFSPGSITGTIPGDFRLFRRNLGGWWKRKSF